MAGLITQILDDPYLDAGRVKDFLDRLFKGENYQLSVRNNVITVKIPRLLTESEKNWLQQASRHHYYQQENEAIRTQSQDKGHAAPLLPSRSSPSSTRNPPITESRVAEADSTKANISDEKNDEVFKPRAGLVAPDTSAIPLFHPTSQQITLMDIRTEPKSSEQVFVKLEQSDTFKQGDKIQSGLYSVFREEGNTSIFREDGETSSVFGMRGYIMWSVDQPDRIQEDRVVQKVAIKRLHKHTPPERFWAEYNSLKLLKSFDHPHVVETLSVFRYEENGDQYFNFLFPLALGNLKRLFRGSYDKNMELQRRAQDSLWGQFAGLSSAVAYLHDSIQMAHRDIKPSNILIYEELYSEGSLVLKLTDFGLSVDLSKALTWETGSLALQSAWQYDSPESRRASPNVGSKTPSAEKFRIPSAKNLLANDIWKLGSVFTEMVAFLVCGGSTGVTNFRDYITTTEGKISSDMFNDTRFDDGEKVKDQVLEWLDHTARKDMRARCLQPVLSEMLAKSAQRPTITRVCEALVEANFPNINYDDGLRLVQFTAAYQMSPLSQAEILQLSIEKWTGRTVDWRPFPSPRPRLRPDQFLMTWKWQGSELCMPLSRDELSRYKPMCLPRTTCDTPLLPIASRPDSSSRQRSPNIPPNTIPQPGGTATQPTLGTIALGAGTAPSPTPPPRPSRDMYWCLEKPFTEPTENHLFCLSNSETLKSDEELYHQVNKAINSTRGWIGWLFSWKRCTEVEFIEFCVVRHKGSEVDPMNSGLLPPVTARDYTHGFLPPEDVRMRAARKQMVTGLMYPSKGKGTKDIASMLPKKLNPPPQPDKMGELGWGLHAKMGFSQWRFLYWLIFCFAFNTIFVALWLVYINSTDLQNAFVPAAIFTAALTFALAVIQISEMREGK